ncbi:MAG: hypothetical protein A2X94_13925 [Bdellovibrionales bacterium GWB1_55_8]|nr:MAG: hypothetical protein A2X94_13925 [Bdellovibrionales bacterium GWB1_55_8]
MSERYLIKLLLISMIVPAAAQAVMEQLIILTPENARKYGFTSKITRKMAPSANLDIEVSHEESEVADITNEVCVYTSKERMTVAEIEKSAPSACMPPLPGALLNIPTKVKRTINDQRT